MKKLCTLMFLAMLLVFAFTACTSDGNGNGGTAAEPANTPPADNAPPAETPPVAPVAQDPPSRDLGGRVITIGTWWVEECTATADPQSAPDRARWNDRRAMEERYNFTIRYVRWSDWEGVRDNIQGELLAGNDDVTIWTVEAGWFATHHGAGLFAPIPLHHFRDDDGVTWNRSVLDVSMRDGSPHAFSTDVNQFAGGVYWNMRLFEEAGLPRDLPFQLQAEGNWNWDTFTDIARRIWRDVDGTGVPAIWPIAGFANDFLALALASNGANYAIVDPATGRFVNNTNTPEFLEAITWVTSLRAEMLAFHEYDVGGEWDAHRQIFMDGLGAMQPAGNYVAGGRLRDNMTDDYGFVAFPQGPRTMGTDRHYAWVTPNFNVIPHFFSQDDIDDIMFAFSLWNRELEDDDPDDWIFANLPNHRDSRSVEETMLYFTRNADNHVMPAHFLMPGLGNVLNNNFNWRVWSPEGNEASVIVEEGQQPWNAFLDRVNEMLN